MWGCLSCLFTLTIASIVYALQLTSDFKEIRNFLTLIINKKLQIHTPAFSKHESKTLFRNCLTTSIQQQPAVFFNSTLLISLHILVAGLDKWPAKCCGQINSVCMKKDIHVLMF
jgi:hypothetical protein